ncbi:hypothetical protein F5I97DRAFT_1831286 [Phlebopus sp. FC_14]|nr:hypothetical protein F5I97DRAFT_1831286 [Phlebopus sp. FC_14]
MASDPLCRIASYTDRPPEAPSYVCPADSRFEAPKRQNVCPEIADSERTPGTETRGLSGYSRFGADRYLVHDELHGVDIVIQTVSCYSDNLIVITMELLPPNARCQVRRVQNIDIIYTDLSCLAIGGQKIPGAVINAFGILLQEKDDNTADYAILSSYLAPIITQGSTSYGTLEEHILAACVSQSPHELLSRPRWVIPLCGGSPSHWVLTWADTGLKEFGLYDSIPGQHSGSWAIPELRKIITAIFAYLGQSDITAAISSWGRVLITPPKRQQQMDSWSCGLFTMMAMQAYVMRHSLELIGDEQKNSMRIKVLDQLLNLPIVRETMEIIETDDDTEQVICDGSTPEGWTPTSQPPMVPMDTQPRTQVSVTSLDTSLETKSFKTAEHNSTKRKHSTPSDDDDTDKESMHDKRSKATSGSRAQKRMESQRRSALEADLFCVDVTAHSVRCTGCGNIIKLHPRTSYGDTEWRRA